MYNEKNYLTLSVILEFANLSTGSRRSNVAIAAQNEA